MSTAAGVREDPRMNDIRERESELPKTDIADTAASLLYRLTGGDLRGYARKLRADIDARGAEKESAT